MRSRQDGTFRVRTLKKGTSTASALSHAVPTKFGMSAAMGGMQDPLVTTARQQQMLVKTKMTQVGDSLFALNDSPFTLLILLFKFSQAQLEKQERR